MPYLLDRHCNLLLCIAYQYESFDGEEHLKAGVDEERAKQAQAVVTQVFEGQLEDVAPADTAQVNLLRGPICSTTHSQKLGDRNMLLYKQLENYLHLKSKKCLIMICGFGSRVTDECALLIFTDLFIFLTYSR